MEKTHIKFPPIPSQLETSNIFTNLKYFGPGAIIASMTIGSGETIFASRGGAVFEYTILWCFILGTLMKGIQVYTGSRYFTLTGEHPIERWAYLPGPRKWFPILIGLICIFCFPGWIGGLSKMLGSLCVWMFHIGTPQIWGTIFILTALFLSIGGGYRFLENTQRTIIAILLLSMIAAVFASRPDSISVIKGLISPSIPSDYEPWVYTNYPDVASRKLWIEIVTYIGAVGGGTYDYIGYLGMLREKKWGIIGLRSIKNSINKTYNSTKEMVSLSEDEKDLKLGLRWLKAPKIDIFFSFGSILIFTLLFVICGASILHKQQLIPDGINLIRLQAQFLRNIHHYLLYLYQLSIFFVFFGTIYGAYEVYTRTFFESARAVFQKTGNLRKVKSYLFLYLTISGLILLWTGWDPISIVTPGAIIGGVFSCGLWCFAMIWSDKKFLPKPYRMGKILIVLTIISGIGLTSFGVIAITDYIRSIF